MLTILISVVLGVILFVFLVKTNWDGMVSACACALVVTVGFGVASIIGSNKPTREVIDSSTPLHSLNDTSALSGSLFLGSGYIDEKESYSYYLVMPDGTFKPDHVEKYGDYPVYVKEDEDGAQNPRLEVIYDTFVDESDFWWGIHLINTRYVFHIPPGSLVEGYTLK